MQSDLDSLTGRLESNLHEADRERRRFGGVDKVRFAGEEHDAGAVGGDGGERRRADDGEGDEWIPASRSEIVVVEISRVILENHVGIAGDFGEKVNLLPFRTYQIYFPKRKIFVQHTNLIGERVFWRTLISIGYLPK